MNELDALNQNVIILDAWGGQKDVDYILEELTEQDFKEYIRFFGIPKHCTKFIQPLDVYFFRQYKIVIRKIVDYLRLFYFRLEVRDRPHCRDFIFRMHSLVYNQLCSEKFQPMLKYAWLKSGYGNMPSNYTFLNVNELLFSKKKLSDCNECGKISFIKCSHCEKILCFECFFFSYHYHDL